VKEGLCYGIFFAVLGTMLLVYSKIFTIMFYAMTLFTFYFFRDPARDIPSEKGVFVSPADGTVVEVDESVLNDFIGGKAKVIKIRLSPFDVHINRSPLSGRISYMKYKRGRRISAYDNMSNEFNERNIIGIEGDDLNAEVTQIAGLFARRIVTWINVGDKVLIGDKVGMIRFGSRTNLTLPEKTEVCVKVGDKVKAGETIVGRIK